MMTPEQIREAFGVMEIKPGHRYIVEYDPEAISALQLMKAIAPLLPPGTPLIPVHARGAITLRPLPKARRYLLEIEGSDAPDFKVEHVLVRVEGRQLLARIQWVRPVEVVQNTITEEEWRDLGRPADKRDVSGTMMHDP